MMSHSPADHVHARLTIVLEGQTVVIPSDIGLGVPGHSSGHFNPHTHDTAGILHIGEGGPAGLSSDLRLVTLADFFDVWRERGGLAGNNSNSRFDATHIMDRTADATHAVRMLVNGQLNALFEQYTPHDEDEIEIRYDALPAAPGSIVLAAASDSGSSSSDRITNATSWQFQVSGVTAGALVQLRSGTAVLGQATATGTTVSVAAAVGNLNDGLVNLTAVQSTNGLTSPASASLAVTLDRAAPQFALAPRAALAGQSYSFDVASTDEGQNGFGYSLIAAPSGASIAPTTGLISWSPATSNIGRHTFTVRGADAAGNSRDVTASLYAVEAAFPWRNPVNSLDVDGDTNVFPLDVLLMVNRINNVAARQLPVPTTSDASPPFFDVTGDNLLTPLDVLQVINFINGQASGEVRREIFTGATDVESGRGEVEAAFGLVVPSIPAAQPGKKLPASSGEAQQPVAESLMPRKRRATDYDESTSTDVWDILLEQLAAEQLRYNM